jgi:hypothetical protein
MQVLVERVFLCFEYLIKQQELFVGLVSCVVTCLTSGLYLQCVNILANKVLWKLSESLFWN